MAHLGTEEHIKDCKLRAVREAVELCEMNMQVGLTACERILQQDRVVLDAIFKMNGRVV